jgi:hypothetical protein
VHTCSLYSCALMHSCLRNNYVHECTTVSQTGVHLMHACLSHPRTHMHSCVKNNHTLCAGNRVIPTHMHVVFPLFPCTCGPLPLKPHVRPSIQPLPTNYKIHKVQDDRTTNMSLATPGSVASRSHNLEISSQLSRQLSNSDRYK